ncbi:MAG: integrase arm-type DNA-binding domain-containing protein [Propionivibrio sp.]|uniref:tyrosine-type recombinase/integrase n=1 Tax=Propionivibrio sp. TaxID=2212460 RepID=UPI001A62BEF7|nr:integrase arm-type DNA-binding domain-containing protein [Propionivibrio sp.]MBL8413983.1 integrase arm-type DNA-binding domain-containing protein [Propionivibrio sp.]
MLTVKEIDNAELKNKPYKIADGFGLYIEVRPNGARYWRMKYRMAGKEKLLSFGVYPEVRPPEARAKAKEARDLIRAGTDPGEKKKAVKREAVITNASTFEIVALEWMEGRKTMVAIGQYEKTLARMVNDVFPWLGKRPISEIDAPEILIVMRRIDSRGARFTAHRVRSEISRVFRYAIATSRAKSDPARDLIGAIPPAVEKHFASITEPAKVAEMLRAFDGFSGTFPVQCALKLAPLLFVRPGELRKAEWAHLDLDKAEWRYRVSKTNTNHLVPLATQAVAILRELYALTGQGRYVFPGARTAARPMSAAAINAALRRMGYDTRTEITGHGFRAMARTILHEELHQKPEVIEHQLAHSVSDTLGTAYNRTKFLKERKAMMQLWADYLDKIKAGADVIPIHGSAA